MNKKAAFFFLAAVSSAVMNPCRADAFIEESADYYDDPGYEGYSGGVIVREVEEDNGSESTSAGTYTDSSSESAWEGVNAFDTSDTSAGGSGAAYVAGFSGVSGQYEDGSGSDFESLLSSFAEEGTVEEKKVGTVKTGGDVLNVRSGQGLQYGVIDTLDNGTTVEVLEDYGDWLYVSVPEYKGYVCADYLDVRTIPVESEGNGSISITIDSEMIRELRETLRENGTEITTAGLGLTPEGNLTLVDDFGDRVDSGKQFITLATKSGNIFYLIIDRDSEGDETVHFLNQVDESDLFALMNEDEVTEIKDQIAAEEAEKAAAEEAERARLEAEKASRETEAETEAGGSGGISPLLLALPLLAVLAGAGAYLYLSFKRRKTSYEKRDPDAGYREDEDLDLYDLPEEPQGKGDPGEDEYYLDET